MARSPATTRGCLAPTPERAPQGFPCECRKPGNMARIVIVDDEENVAEPLAYRLRALGHDVAIYQDGRIALERLLAQPPDLLVLDLMLPGLDGLEICRRLRPHQPTLPILMLTARGEEIDRVVGLESGADDYVVKPFSLREMEARVKIWLRRASPDSAALPQPAARAATILSCGPFVLDRRSGVFTRSGAVVDLAPREMELMALLMEQPGEVVAREELLRKVWGEDFLGEPKTLDVHMRWLRVKLEEEPAKPCHLVTVRGRGFRLDP